MAEIRFYHLVQSQLEQALPQLLERTLAKGWRAVVQASSPERVGVLNGVLWTYNDRSFLPHGSAEDGDAAVQPIWLTDGEDTPNQAQVLFLVDGATRASLDGFELICLVFDGHDQPVVQQARGLWKNWKEANQHKLTYWQQGPQGWEMKASADPESSTTPP